MAKREQCDPCSTSSFDFFKKRAPFDLFISFQLCHLAETVWNTKLLVPTRVVLSFGLSFLSLSLSVDMQDFYEYSFL